MNRTAARLGALAATAALGLASTAPAHAATVARASATAYTVKVGGAGTDSGTVTSTHTGAAERTTGQTSPTISLLENQDLLNAGTLSQQAATGVDREGNGWSAACSGVAGEGASVAEVGDSQCLQPGQPVGLSVANLDLSDARLAQPRTALAELNELEPVMDQLVGPLTQTLSESLAPLGETGIAGTVGAVEARCVNGPQGPEGMATITDGDLTLSLGGRQVELVDLPVHPAPNTDVLVDLDSVLTSVLSGLRTDLNNTLDGMAEPLTAAVDPVQEQLVDGVVAQVAEQLAPLSDNLLRITLNEQDATGESIAVTALRLEVLPAAQQLGAENVVDARIGTVECGPAGVARTAAPAAPEAPERDLPAVPTVVASGVGGPPGPAADVSALALAALVVAGAATGVLVVRRASRT